MFVVFVLLQEVLPKFATLMHVCCARNCQKNKKSRGLAICNFKKDDWWISGCFALAAPKMVCKQNRLRQDHSEGPEAQTQQFQRRRLVSDLIIRKEWR